MEDQRAALVSSLSGAIDEALQFIDREHETNPNERFGLLQSLHWQPPPADSIISFRFCDNVQRNRR